jgi:uncharacterized RDD family membrane protein YckC
MNRRDSPVGMMPAGVVAARVGRRMTDGRPPSESDRKAGSGLAGAAGRATFYPARAAARLWRSELDSAIDAALRSPEAEEVIDRALAGPLPEALARSLVRHHVAERIVAELARSGELDRLVREALASGQAVELTDTALSSDAVKHAVATLAASPDVRNAIAAQSSGLADEVMGAVRTAAGRVDDRVGRGGPPYAGWATRATAFVADLALAGAVYTSAVGVGALIGSLVGGLHPAWLVTLALTVGWTVMAGAYFAVFWSTAGQTPGMRLMHVRVTTAAGARLGVGRSLVRFALTLLAIVPLFAGFLPVLIDRRRRSIADFGAGTVVVHADRERAGDG